MKKLRFEYSMELSFSVPVRDHHFTLRCLPQNSGRQQICVDTCRISPVDSISEMIDGFGNHKMSGCCLKPHDTFSCHVSGTAMAEGMKAVDEPFHPMYRYPSVLTQYDPVLAQFAKRFGEQGKYAGLEGKDAVQFGVEVMGALYERLVYESGVTDIHTTAGEALVKGRGVCQDYAHIMTAVMRFLGVPARYVNGIMIGEGATHAWVEIHTGEGWYGLDPTNNLHVDDYYIKFAHGRDYGDCIVDKGRFLGLAQQSQKIYVNVEEIKQ